MQLCGELQGKSYTFFMHREGYESVLLIHLYPSISGKERWIDKQDSWQVIELLTLCFSRQWAVPSCPQVRSARPVFLHSQDGVLQKSTMISCNIFAPSIPPLPMHFSIFNFRNLLSKSVENMIDHICLTLSVTADLVTLPTAANSKLRK